MTDITQAPSAQLGFLDNPHAPDVFADAATGWFHFNGNVRITFETVRVNHVSSPGPAARVVIGRLVMSLQSAESMARGLLEFIEAQRSQPQAVAQSTPPTLQ
jgi:voltage-gated potassium channel Kch